MYQRYKERFGTAGVVVGVIALVLALVTGAYAAGGGLSGKQKKEVEKIAKKYAGKPGATGAAGTNGANGTNGKDGAPGAPGEKGEKGDAGTNGTNGTNGTSVTNTQFSGLQGPCPEGGSKFVVGTNTTYACDGEEGEKGDKGEKGDTGEPWTAGGVLPPEATETGAWVFAGEGALTGFGTLNVALASFTLPLSDPLEESQMHLVPAGGPSTTECPGTAAEPAAAPEQFCAYVSELEHATFAVSVPSGISGAKVLFLTEGKEAIGSGSWALTAPPTP